MQPAEATDHATGFEGSQAPHHNLKVMYIHYTGEEGDHQLHSVGTEELGAGHCAVLVEDHAEQLEMAGVDKVVFEAVHQQLHGARSLGRGLNVAAGHDADIPAHVVVQSDAAAQLPDYLTGGAQSLRGL